MGRALSSEFFLFRVAPGAGAFSFSSAGASRRAEGSEENGSSVRDRRVAKSKRVTCYCSVEQTKVQSTQSTQSHRTIMYRLSTTLYGHDDDVKAVASVNDELLVSGSRDTTVRVWNRLDKTKDFSSSIINFKSSKFINALAIYRYNDDVLIVSAGNDNMINLTSPAAVATDFGGNNDTDNFDQYCLVGHTANICTLDTYDQFIMSGSWDSTAKVWNKSGEVLFDLKGHENSVWSVKFLNEREFLTCGADRTIRKWNGNKQVKVFIAHDDVVRDLLLLPNGDFASCSNDSTIKIWDGITFQNKATLLGHQSFIYSLALLSNGDIVSCGEDRSVRIWRNNQCIQVITLPCMSIWKVLTLNNDDIVLASSDSKIRIFSNNESRFAKQNQILAFQKELEESSISESSLFNINKSQIPGIESLNTSEPKIEGETKYIRSNKNTIDLYQWNENKWIKIGQMVDGSSSNQKQFYNGSYYDYVFNIDVEDGKPPLKLPVNISDNPYDIAETFLANYNLPHSYLQQIVDFIMQNAEGVTLDGKSNKTNSGILPQTNYLTFEKIDQAKLISAFKKLNSKQSPEKQITDSVETLLMCEDYDKIHKVALEIIENWSDDSKLLGFDILRAIITLIKPSEDLFPIIRTGLESQHLNPKVQMMTIRILINTFAAKGWGEQMMLDDDILDIIFTDYLYDNLSKDEKFFPITISTLLFNYSVLANKFQLVKFQDKVLTIIDKVLKIPTVLKDEESAYRLLVSIGTLNVLKSIQDTTKYLSPFANLNGERFQVIKKEITE